MYVTTSSRARPHLTVVGVRVFRQAMRKMNPFDCATQWWIPVQMKDSKQSLSNRISDFLCTMEVSAWVDTGERWRKGWRHVRMHFYAGGEVGVCGYTCVGVSVRIHVCWG